MGHLLKTCPPAQLISPTSGKKVQIFGKVGIKIDLAGEINIDENF